MIVKFLYRPVRRIYLLLSDLEVSYADRKRRRVILKIDQPAKIEERDPTIELGSIRAPVCVENSINNWARGTFEWISANR